MIGPGYASISDSWTALTVRYLVPARERRKWSSRLPVEIGGELSRGDNARRVPSGYPRVQTQPLPPPDWPAGDG